MPHYICLNILDVYDFSELLLCALIDSTFLAAPHDTEQGSIFLVNVYPSAWGRVEAQHIFFECIN